MSTGAEAASMTDEELVRNFKHLSNGDAKRVLAKEIAERFEAEIVSNDSAVDEWREDNKEFRYDPPNKEPEAWSPEEIETIVNRSINRDVIWVCSSCSQSRASLSRMQSHVRNKHLEYLLNNATI